MKARVNSVIIEVAQGDMLTFPTEAITVVTDPNLSVSSDLHHLAGPTVKEQTTIINWRDIGQSAITDAGNLPFARKIIHTVGPRWGEGSERGKLEIATWSTLTLAEEYKLASIALPAISVGTLGYPVEACAKIMLTRVIDFTFEALEFLRLITFCLEDEGVYNAFKTEFEQQIHDLLQTGEGQVATV